MLKIALTVLVVLVAHGFGHLLDQPTAELQAKPDEQVPSSGSLPERKDLNPLSRLARGVYHYTDANGSPQIVNYLVDPLAPNYRLALAANPAEIEKLRTPQLIALNAAINAERMPMPVMMGADMIREEKMPLTNNDEKRLPIMSMMQLPEPVRDTPEVAQAKREHFIAHELAKARLDMEAKKLQYYSLPYVQAIQAGRPSLIPATYAYGGYGQPLIYRSSVVLPLAAAIQPKLAK